MTCFDCAQTAQHKHHVVPRVLGGTRTIPLCPACHGKVHGRDFTHHRALTVAGLAKARACGVQLGRPNVHGPETIRRVRELRTQGLSMRAIGKATGVSTSSVGRYLGGV